MRRALSQPPASLHPAPSALRGPLAPPGQETGSAHGGLGACPRRRWSQGKGLHRLRGGGQSWGRAGRKRLEEAQTVNK